MPVEIVVTFTPLAMLTTLLLAHCLCDYPLQGDFLSKAKNVTAPIPGVPWWQAMGAHCAIHGGAVALITGSTLLGAAEAVVHFATDYAKCTQRISFNTDQFIHLAAKLVWFVIWLLAQ